MREDSAGDDSSELAIHAIQVGEQCQARGERKYTNRVKDLRHRLNQPQLATEFGFPAFHLAVVGFVVVAHQVENTVKDKNAHLVIKGATKAARVSFRHRRGDGNIADILRRVICSSGVNKMLSRASISSAPSLGFASIRCKRQYIRGASFATIGAVPAGDLSVAHQANGERVLRQPQPAPRTSKKFVEVA